MEGGYNYLAAFHHLCQQRFRVGDTFIAQSNDVLF
jgi:hypothetical protein